MAKVYLHPTACDVLVLDEIYQQHGLIAVLLGRTVQLLPEMRPPMPPKRIEDDWFSPGAA